MEFKLGLLGVIIVKIGMDKGNLDLIKFSVGLAFKKLKLVLEMKSPTFFLYISKRKIPTFSFLRNSQSSENVEKSESIHCSIRMM